MAEAKQEEVKKEPTKKVEKKIKKKKWVTVLAPKEFKGRIIGETPCDEEPKVIGRNLIVNLMELTGDPKKQQNRVTFKINKLEGNNALTELTKYEISPSNLKRFVRRAKTKIDDSFTVNTKDNIKVKVKPLMVTRGEVPNSTATALRHKTNEIITEAAKNLNYTDVLTSIVEGKLQHDARDKLKKVYPLSIFEIRVFERLS